MRILVFGAGAIGSLFGGLLSREHEVLLVGRPAHVDAVRRRGLRIRSGEGPIEVRPSATPTAPPEERFDLIAVAVKAHQLAGAVEALRPLARPPARLLLLQNGIGNEAIVADLLPPERIVRAIVYEGASLAAPGIVAWHGSGLTFLGRPLADDSPGEAESALADMAAALRVAGLPVRVARDIRREIWRKLVVNAAINPLGAVTGLPNGALLRSPYLRATLHALVHEAEAVARAEADLVLDLAENTERIARNTGENRNSMLLDVDAGRTTEIAFLNEKIVAYGRRHGVATPLHEQMVDLVRARQGRGGSA